MINIVAFVQFTAILITGLFTGSAIYCSLVEHPARLACGVELAATVFPPAFKKAAFSQIIYILIGTLSSAYVGYQTNLYIWYLCSLIFFAIIPYTFIALMPINRKLLDEKIDKTSPHTKKLLEQWGERHAIRSIVALIIFCIMLNSVLKVIS
jgi:hypothetical protein